MKFIFIANNNVGNGFSGGDRIFTELIKNWSQFCQIILFGSEEAIKISRNRGVQKIKFVKTSNRNLNDKGLSITEFFKHILVRSYRGLKSIKKNYSLVSTADYVYSVSDFYPDLLPALYLKLKIKKIRWVAGFYLFAPSPFSKDFPYKRTSLLKGIYYWFSQKLSYFLVKKFADFVLVTSEPDIIKFVTKKRGKERIIVVRGGVDLSEVKKAVLTNKKVWDACFVGRFHPQKGVLELIDIWKNVCLVKKNARLAIVGEGPLEKELKIKISKLDLARNIDLLGFKDGTEKYDIFIQSKIIVHPAIYDSGGMAAAEGMAWGLPAVGFDLEALKSYYPQGMLKARLGNNKDFADLIIKLLDNKVLYQNISNQAKNLIQNDWNWEKRAFEIYKTITEK